MKKNLLSLVLALMPMMVMAQQAMTVKVDSAGQLARHIPDSIMFTIPELTVSGPLNGADLKLIGQIVTRNKTDKKNENVPDVDHQRSSNASARHYCGR